MISMAHWRAGVKSPPELIRLLLTFLQNDELRPSPSQTPPGGTEPEAAQRTPRETRIRGVHRV